jgi:hypothetical protein
MCVPPEQSWTAFFDKWGYKERQREDIAAAIQSILEEV